MIVIFLKLNDYSWYEYGMNYRSFEFDVYIFVFYCLSVLLPYWLSKTAVKFVQPRVAPFGHHLAQKYYVDMGFLSSFPVVPSLSVINTAHHFMDHVSFLMSRVFILHRLKNLSLSPWKGLAVAYRCKGNILCYCWNRLQCEYSMDSSCHCDVTY